VSVHFDLFGPSGRLEALFDPGDPPLSHGHRIGAVVAHPHPLHGGTMHNTNIYRTAKALAAAGFDTLRFNFRGVGLSQGVHDHGPGEMADVRAAIDAMQQFGCARTLGVGYSFGSIQMFKVGLDDPRVAAIAAMGLPLTSYDVQFIRSATKPVCIVQGEDDPFGSPAAIRAALSAGSALPPNIEIVAVERVGHFFEGKSHDVATAIVQFGLRTMAVL
jgi:hypothetical protein